MQIADTVDCGGFAATTTADSLCRLFRNRRGIRLRQRSPCARSMRMNRDTRAVYRSGVAYWGRGGIAVLLERRHHARPETALLPAIEPVPTRFG